MSRARPIVIALGLILIWQAFVWLTAAPPYMLPDPVRVATRLVSSAPQLAHHAGITAIEIVLGLVLGVAVGAGSALLMVALPPIQPWLLPVLIVGQTLPVFALAPLLTLWFGYGIASKIAMAVLIIYFPVTAALYDGLRRVEPAWLDLARTLDGKPLLVLLRLRLPAALPSFGSGLRVAAAIAPIGAVVGEWVGSSQGLGYLMLYANARVQTDLVFAALVVLMTMALLLYFAVDAGLRALMPWSPDARPLRQTIGSSGDRP